MSYSALAVANEFIKLSLLANDGPHEVTNMKLQKLVYIAHGYLLGLTDRPLINNDIHAFEWGPVIPVLYKNLKSYGDKKIENLITTEDPGPTDALSKAVIDRVWSDYGHADGLSLSRLTHKPDTPWSKTWAVSKHGVIKNDLIRDYYRNFISEQSALSL